MPAGKVIDRDRGMKRILKDLDRAAGWQVTVGVHGKDAGERGGFEPGEMDNVAIFTIQEFGAPGNTFFGHPAPIPERSSLRAAFDANVKKYVRVLMLGARKIIDGTLTGKQAVALAGEAAVADVINLINAGIPPPNSPVTIARKGSTKPLEDTGQMKAAIKPVVTKK